MNEKFCISIRISLKFVPEGRIDNDSPLVQVMAWCQTCDKPLPEPMLTQFTDVYAQNFGGGGGGVNELSAVAGVVWSGFSILLVSRPSFV